MPLLWKKHSHWGCLGATNGAPLCVGTWHWATQLSHDRRQGWVMAHTSSQLCKQPHLGVASVEAMWLYGQGMREGKALLYLGSLCFDHTTSQYLHLYSSCHAGALWQQPTLCCSVFFFKYSCFHAVISLLSPNYQCEHLGAARYTSGLTGRQEDVLSCGHVNWFIVPGVAGQ